MEFRVLGPLEVVADDRAVALGGAKQRALLALLVLSAPEPISLERLMDELWGERPPGTAAHAVRVYVSELRKLLRGASADRFGVRLRTLSSGYVLEVEAERIDARRCERLVAEARGLLAEEPESAREHFQAALSLWRGAPLVDVQQSGIAKRAAERFEELRALAAEGVVEASLACGEDAEVIGPIKGLIAAEPLRERPRQQLMLALYRSGRHAEALAAYRDACEALDEIGLQPGPELKRLEQAILRHDASLGVSRAGPDLRADTGAGGAACALEGEGRPLPAVGSVTMLFTDIAGSTILLDRLGDRYPGLLAEHHRVLREAISETEGYELVVAGDSFFVVFADALAAVDCAVRSQRALAELEWPGGESVLVRMGIHTGTPTVRDGTYVGMDVHRAARVMAVANGGQILITEPARASLVPSVALLDLGHHRLKDLPAPEHLFQLVAPGLLADFAPLRSLNQSNLPSVSSPLVGRTSEIADALNLIGGEVRLVTMLGPGGTGKTRLALEIAARAAPRYRDGVWFASLAPLTDHALIGSEIAAALGVAEAEGEPLAVTLAAALARRELLLVLDNFEHLIEGAGIVSQLLERTSHVDFLVTSREALGLRGEHRMHVPPLPLEDASELFLQRALAVRQDVVGGPADRAAVERICLRLDALPLALELAAARAAVFSVRAIESRLAQRLELPEGSRDRPDRQRTLRATIDWSYELLTREEQAAFRGLAPFIGGARLEAVRSALADAGLDPLQAVSGLVEKSLLRRRDDPDGEPRFWMLETVREYAAELMTRSGDTDPARRKHAMYYLALAEEADRQVQTSDQSMWLERLDADHDNLRSAFDYLSERAPHDTLRLAAALGSFWDVRWYISEGQQRLRIALRSAPTDDLAAAKALFYSGRFAFFGGDRREAEPLLRESLRVAQEQRDVRVQVLALTHLGFVAKAAGDPQRNVEMDEEALAIARAGSDEWALGTTLNALGDTLDTLGETDRARPLLEEALNLWRRRRQPLGTASTALNLADLLLNQGDLDAAEALFLEARDIAREINYAFGEGFADAATTLLALHRGNIDQATARMTESLDFIRTSYNIMAAVALLAAAATLAAVGDDPRQAAKLWAAYQTAMSDLGINDTCGANRLRDYWLPKARETLDAAVWDAAWTAGTTLTPQEALELSERD